MSSPIPFAPSLPVFSPPEDDKDISKGMLFIIFVYFYNFVSESKPLITARQLSVVPRYTMLIQLCQDCKGSIECVKNDDLVNTTHVRLNMCGGCAFANKKIRFG